MRWLRSHPVHTTVLAVALSAAAVVAIAGAYGFSTFAAAWSHTQVGWLALAVLAVLLALPAYLLAYRAVAAAGGAPPLGLRLLVAMVIAGFGSWAPGGGFTLDKRALHVLHADEDAATVRVLGLAALEWAVLAPAAWISAVVLIASGDTRPMPSLTWPWAIAVPVGFGIGLYFACAQRRERLRSRGGRWRETLATTLAGVGVLMSLARGWRSCWTAWVGVALYWALDIAGLYGALRFIGLRPTIGEAVIAFATGYALTRRSLPLGGAGVTEALMTFALHWVGQPVAPALAAVVVYRVFNFLVPAAPAVLALPRIYALATAPGRGRASHPRRRALAAELLGHLKR